MAEKESHNNGSERKNVTTASSDIAALINAMQSFQQQQTKVRAEQQREEMASSEQWYQRQAEQHGEEMAKMIAQLAPGRASAPVTSPPVAMATPSFAAFDPTSEAMEGLLGPVSNMYGGKFNTNRASA